MTSKREKLSALANVGDGSTLCTTEAQDKYFVVLANGCPEKVDLATAARLYLRASCEDGGNLLWGKAKRRIKNQPSGHEARTKKWREQMEQALGRRIED